jgi:hypothetical protein
MELPTTFLTVRIFVIPAILAINYLAYLLTHICPPCSFYLSPICVVSMVTILVRTPRVGVK